MFIRNEGEGGVDGEEGLLTGKDGAVMTGKRGREEGRKGDGGCVWNGATGRGGIWLATR